jgi:hypothetical protein
MWCQCTSLWSWCYVYISAGINSKPVYILMVVPLCTDFCRAWSEVSVHLYGGAVVYAFPTYLIVSQCTSLWFYRYVCISARPDVNPFYILMVVPFCIHFLRAGWEASAYSYGGDDVYAYRPCVMLSLCTPLLWSVVYAFPTCVMWCQCTSLWWCRCECIYACGMWRHCTSLWCFHCVCISAVGEIFRLPDSVWNIEGRNQCQDSLCIL